MDDHKDREVRGREDRAQDSEQSSQNASENLIVDGDDDGCCESASPFGVG